MVNSCVGIIVICLTYLFLIEPLLRYIFQFAAWLQCWEMKRALHCLQATFYFLFRVIHTSRWTALTQQCNLNLSTRGIPDSWWMKSPPADCSFESPCLLPLLNGFIVHLFDCSNPLCLWSNTWHFSSYLFPSLLFTFLSFLTQEVSFFFYFFFIKAHF